MRLSRSRRTRSGLASRTRRVAGEFRSGDIACHRSPQAAAALEEQELSHEVRRLIRKFTRSVRWVRLLDRRLLFDDQIKRLAEEYDVPFQSARRKVMHARRFIKAHLDDDFLDSGF